MRFHDMEEIKAVGKWWVPGRKQQPFPGTLNFLPEDYPSLKLFDNIKFLTKAHDGKYTDRGFSGFLPLVCGKTEFGQATLLHMRHSKADFLPEDYPSLKLFDNIKFLTKAHDGKYTDRGFSGFLPLVCGKT
ncbi:MAG: hypothetical protein D3923_17545, partial [Candidatus Electrothrix sp. AR3]|nr:hypothetical protein [Candidatus Electrothrix sp. AR3]